MRNKSKKGFQAGDIITPLPGKTQSMYWSLKGIIELEIVEVCYDKNSDLKVKLIKGFTYHRENYGVRDSKSFSSERHQPFFVSDTMFQLKTKDYEIF